MSEQEVSRIEAALLGLTAEVGRLKEEMAGTRQWRFDRGELCDRHTRQGDALATEIATERLERTKAIAKLWTEIRVRMSLWAFLSGFMGTLISGLLLWSKVGPIITQATKGG